MKRHLLLPKMPRSVLLLRCGFLFSSMWLGSCASYNPEHFKGENLVVPFADELKHWQLFKKKEQNYRANMWQKPGERWANTYAVTVQYNAIVDLQEKRLAMDAPGEDNCETFLSELLTHPKQTQLPTLYWETTCRVGGNTVAKIFHLMIQGTDSFYHIQKAWRSDFTSEELALWRSRLNDTYVCDNRTQDNLCPVIE